MERFEHGGDVYNIPGIKYDFSISCNPLGIPETVKEALCSSTDLYSRYPDTKCRKLRRSISDYLGVPEDMILCGNGSADLINRICAAFTPEKGLVTAPSFSDYQRCIELYGGETSEYPLSPGDDFRVKPDILSWITEETDIVFLCTPNNPTGQLIDHDLLCEIAARCEECGTFFVLDECFLPFTDGQSMLDVVKDFPHTIILRAFTKLYSMAGIRLGHIVGDPDVLKKISPFGGEWSVSIPAQVCGISALELEPAWTSMTREYVSNDMEKVAGRLEKLGLTVFPPAANYVLVRSPFPLAEPLLERGILVRDCSNFTGLDKNYIRIGLLDEDADMALIRAVEEIINGNR